MIKEMLYNTVETALNTASVAISCVGATVDTIRDEEVKQAWKAKRYEIKTIHKKEKKELLALYAKYKKESNKVVKAAKLAKQEVNAQFGAIVKESFSAHLKERRTNKTAANKELAASAQ